MAEVRVRYPVPTKEALKTITEHWAAKMKKPPEQILLEYVQQRRREVEDQDIEILKAQKRKKKIYQCIELAEELMEGYLKA